jgi:hypothetical protein
VNIEGHTWAGDLQYAPWNTAREKLAQWMIEHSFATGHGDTFEELLKELSWQIQELRDARR